MTRFDSYIFDMDGTLWDAVDSYCAVWNRTNRELGIEGADVYRAALEPLMGLPLTEIYDRLIGRSVDRNRYFEALTRNEDLMMPELGGILYPDVPDTLAELERRGAKLFMVSNCGPDGLPNFLRFTGLSGLITDALSLGSTGLDKADNMKTIIDRYNLTSPVYVGDTAGDCASTHAAGLPFVWAAYGFGKDVPDADYTIDSFSRLLDI